MIKDVIYNAKLKIEEESVNYSNFLKYGNLYSYSPYEDLIEYTSILERNYDNKVRKFEQCLSPLEVESLIDKVLRITGKPCHSTFKDLTVDLSNRDKWISKNPMCVSYQDWEKWSYYICGKLNIDFKIEKKTCDFVLELTRKTIHCDILVYVKAQKKSCDLGIKLDVSKERCQAELKILVTESNCDLSLKTYVELKKCNISFDMIKKVYDCNLKLNINSKKEVVLVTDLNEYALDCINPESLESFSEINQSATVNVQDILNNYQ